jgi:dihydroxyacetone synthase
MAPGLVETGLLAESRNGNTSKSQNTKNDITSADSSENSTFKTKRQTTGWVPVSEDDHAVLAVRNLCLDICMQNGGGHGGSALGMAAIGVALWKHVMRYNPTDPDWFDRDRFVLSNGK